VRTIVQDYYRQQGWHPESGAPFLGTLQALDIADYANFAEQAVAMASEQHAPVPREPTFLFAG
jgi:hypothetical protein